MTLGELRPGQYAVIEDERSWADKMMVYRQASGRLVVYDTKYYRVCVVSWENNNIKDGLDPETLNVKLVSCELHEEWK